MRRRQGSRRIAVNDGNFNKISLAMCGFLNDVDRWGCLLDGVLGQYRSAGDFTVQVCDIPDGGDWDGGDEDGRGQEHGDGEGSRNRDP